jgi:DNA-binding MarR family transcriptional regulator
MSDDFALENQLCFAIYNANLWFGRFYQQALKPFGLTYTQYLILLALWENGQMSLKDLSEALSLKSNTLTPLLKRMEDGDWVARLRPQKDRRQLIVQLTSKGKSSRKNIEQTISSCIAKGIDHKDTTIGDFDIFAHMLTESKKLSEHLKRIVEHGDE